MDKVDSRKIKINSKNNIFLTEEKENLRINALILRP